MTTTEQDINEKLQQLENSLGEIFLTINCLPNEKQMPDSETDSGIGNNNKLEEQPHISRDMLRLSLKRPGTPDSGIYQPLRSTRSFHLTPDKQSQKLRMNRSFEMGTPPDESLLAMTVPMGHTDGHTITYNADASPQHLLQVP